MNKLIIDTLKTLGYPIGFQTYLGTETTYITFFNMLEGLGNFEDDEASTEDYYIQVDVWSKGDYTLLVENVLEALKNAGFRRKYVTEFYENDTKIYHKVIRVTKSREII